MSDDDQDVRASGSETLPISRRSRLRFPGNCDLNTRGKHTWCMALLRQHAEVKSFLKEGRNALYITLKDGPLYTQLTTEGFHGVILNTFER